MNSLSKEDVMGLRAVARRNRSNLSNSEMAKLFGVSEGTVRYHLKRERENIPDKRANKPMKASPYAHIIEHWMENSKGENPPPSVKELYEYLFEEHEYEESYRSVLRYVRKHYPPPRVRPRRRVEFPAGLQAQVDWAEDIEVRIDGELKKVNALVMSLSYSRGTAVIWSYKKDEISWINCHNKAFEFLGGIPAVLRPDNTKTAVIRGQGSTGKLNEIYKNYARDMGFHINPCRARRATDKGKVEAKVKLVKRKLSARGREFRNLEEFQKFSDDLLVKEMKRLRSPVTGKSVYESMIEEVKALRPCPDNLPEAFDVIVSRKVGIDCLVQFEDHSYSVPFPYTGSYVQVRGCVGKVQIFFNSRLIATHPRGTKKLLLIDPSHYEGRSTEKVSAPEPLGKVGKALLDCWDIPVEKRAIRAYERLLRVIK